ncbi:MAG: phosphoglucosamine mutase [Clostridia bacterium]|nr:phosphoglucosamine mutase [Clostridia bacterium]
MKLTKLFGTDGIRGVVNQELTCDLAFKTGLALSSIIKQKNENFEIIIGKDTRKSCDMLECALSAAICSMGGNVTSIGVVPTPAIAFLTEKFKFQAGIMISASHNSYEFNGIKIFNSQGFKLSDILEQQIENIIFNNNFENTNNYNTGTVKRQENLINYYIENLRNSINIDKNRDFKILIDCANGSASATVGKIFDNFNTNLKISIINNNYNGTNINQNCGSVHIENLKSKILEEKFDIGIAFDGDADRCLAIDNHGKIIDGDTILGICAQNLKKNNKLSGNTVVGTVMSNLGLKKFCAQNNINFVETQVGDRYVLEKILDKSYNFGGEQSGHVIFKDHANTGDGQLTALKLLDIIVNSGESSSYFNNLITKFPQKTNNIIINSNQKGLLNRSPEIIEYIKNINNMIENDGRILVRESGTEPKIRVMIEHKNEHELNNLLIEVTETIRNFFNITV